MLHDLASLLWLQARHLRSELNFYLWAAGADLDDARDLTDRIYLLYLALIVGGNVIACWMWLLGMVEGGAGDFAAYAAAFPSGLSQLAALVLAAPVACGVLWSVRSAWRSPWAPSAPDIIWLAQTGIGTGPWALTELLPRAIVAGVVGGVPGYLFAAFFQVACGAAHSEVPSCLAFAVAVALAISAARAMSWAIGMVRMRAGSRHRLPLSIATIAAGTCALGAAGLGMPMLARAADTMLLHAPGNPSAPIIACAIIALAAIGLAVALAALLPRTALTREAGVDVDLYAVRRMAVYNPSLYRDLVRRSRQARRAPIGRMPGGAGNRAILARALISTLRRYDTWLRIIGVGAVLSPSGVALLGGSLAPTAAALGLMGGEAGGRVLGAAMWIMFALRSAELPRAVSRVFLDDERNRFMRDHLPVSSPVLLALDAAPAFILYALASCIVAAFGGYAGMQTGPSLVCMLALDIMFALCGALDAADARPRRLHLSCEAAIAVCGIVLAVLSACVPAGMLPLAFMGCAAVTALVVSRLIGQA